MTPTTLLDPQPRAARAPAPAPTHVDLDVVVPVYNEQAGLAASVERLHTYLLAHLPMTFRITVADNASTDGTWDIARDLEQRLPGVRAVHLDQKGRGRALHQVWSASDAAVLAYMDVDLSTDLAAVLPLVAPLLSGHSDLAIGTRLARTSRVVRGPKRELISRGYNLLLRTTLATRFSDAQCGFKAIRADRAAELLPLVEDTSWFFDTELLVLAERSGMRIHEVPVDWVDDPDSRVDIVATAIEDLRGIVRVGRGLASGRIALPVRPDDEHDGVPRGLLPQLLRFAVVGVLSTLAYLVLFLVLRGPVGAQWANATALLMTAVGNTALNRRHTFGVRGRTGRVRHQAQGLVVFAVGLALTACSLALLHALAPDAGRALEVGVLVLANLGATLVRFLLFRSWVFSSARDAADARPVTLPAQARTDRRIPR